MLTALHASSPARDRADKMMLYAPFIGSWSGRAVRTSPDGTKTESSCEVHFSWVLEGRAIQDVWIVPARSERQSIAADAYNLYGTTLRIYDPKHDVWHVTWFNPVTQLCCRMTGRKIGDQIIQEYITDEGMRCQWLFTDLTDIHFHWIGRGTTDGGQTWRVQTEFFMDKTDARMP